MTTGSRGLHVVAPLRRESSYDDVLAMAKSLAAAITGGRRPLHDRVPEGEARPAVFVDVPRQPARPDRGGALQRPGQAGRARGDAA